MYPDGEAQQTGDFHAQLRGAHRSFSHVAQAFGAHGETVTNPEALGPAIERGLAAVDRGQAAVLHVRIPAI